MLFVMSNPVEIANQVKIRLTRSPRSTRVSSSQNTGIDGRPQFLITNAKLNAQHIVHVLRVGYELARFCRDASYDSLLSSASLRHLGKGRIVRGTNQA